jgi:hypothetical protein
VAFDAVALVLALGLSTAAETPTNEPARVELEDPARRRVMALHVVARRGYVPAASTSDILLAAGRAAAKHTHLEVRTPEQLGVEAGALDACSAVVRLSCWHRELELTGSARPEFLLAVAMHPSEGGKEELFAMLVPVAARWVDGLAPPLPPDPEPREQALEKETVETPLAPVATSDLAALEEYFSRLFEVDFRPRIERSKLWGPRPKRELPLFVQPPTPAVEATSTHPVRAVTRWGGLAIAAAGLALTVVGVGAESDAGALRIGCLQRGAAAGRCEGLGPATFGLDATGAPTTDVRAVNPSGLPILPLGLGVVAAGGTWGATSWLLGEDEDAPWLGLALGVAAGAAAFGVGALTHGR